MRLMQVSYSAKNALVLLIFFACNAAVAAGFDCKKATSDIEKIICSSERLSALDEALNKQFRDALEKADDRTSLVKAQKAWIQERNKCVDSKCLEKAYESRQASLKSSAACPVQESDLLGQWTAEGEQDFEEMLFEIRNNKRLFFSWRHHRPEMPGIWSLQKCELHIEHVDNPKLSFEYAIEKHSKRVLRLRELNSKEASVYTKLK